MNDFKLENNRLVCPNCKTGKKGVFFVDHHAEARVIVLCPKCKKAVEINLKTMTAAAVPKIKNR